MGTYAHCQSSSRPHKLQNFTSKFSVIVHETWYTPANNIPLKNYLPSVIIQLFWTLSWFMRWMYSDSYSRELRVWEIFSPGPSWKGVSLVRIHHPRPLQNQLLIATQWFNVSVTTFSPVSYHENSTHCDKNHCPYNTFIYMMRNSALYSIMLYALKTRQCWDDLCWWYPCVMCEQEKGKSNRQ
jgi:hypothetical protein